MTLAWSFSRLESWRICPRRFAALHIDKTVEDGPSEARDRGSRIHEAIAARVLDGTSWPAECASFARVVDKIVDKLRDTGELRVEHRVAVTRELTQCAWDDDRVWLRAIFDLLVLRDSEAVILDWKTGKRKAVPTDQLRISSAMAFALFPSVETVSVAYIWLTETPVCATFSRYQRAAAPRLLENVLPEVENMQRGIEARDFPPRPSGLCRKWCSVVTCEFNGRRQ